VQSIQVTLTRRTDAHESNVQPPTPADAENTPTNLMADRMAEERIAAARAARMSVAAE